MKNIIADFTVRNCDTLRLKGLTQWDYGRVLEIRLENMPDIFEAHFSYKGFDDALVVEVMPENGVATIPIPNIITTQDKDATCWIYYEDETSGATYKTIILSINPRTKPHDYVYTETEVFNYRIFKKELEARIADAGKVKTVNGKEPDEEGNIEVDGVKSFNDLEDKPFGKEGGVEWALEERVLYLAGEQSYEFEPNDELKTMLATTGKVSYLCWDGEFYKGETAYNQMAMMNYIQFDNDFKIWDYGDNIYSLEFDESKNGEHTFGIASSMETIKTIDEIYLPKHLQFGESTKEIDIIPQQDLVYVNDDLMYLTDVRDISEGMGYVFTATLEIDGRTSEVEVDYNNGTVEFEEFRINLLMGNVYDKYGVHEEGKIIPVRLYAVKSNVKKIDEKFLPETGGNPDWNQNDETASDYVKNRPFYKTDGTYIVEPMNITFEVGSDTPNESFDFSEIPSEFGVQWNDKVYHCDLSWDRWGESWWFGCLEGDCPFSMHNRILTRLDTSSSATVKFAVGTPLPEPIPISPEYLPDMKGATSEENGVKGMVPAPPMGGQDLVLLGDGTWGHNAGTFIKMLDNKANYNEQNSNTHINMWELPTGVYLIRGTVHFGFRKYGGLTNYSSVTHESYALYSIYPEGEYIVARQFGGDMYGVDNAVVRMLPESSSSVDTETYLSLGHEFRLYDSVIREYCRITLENGELKVTKVE